MISLVQGCCISIAAAMEIQQPCTKPTSHNLCYFTLPGCSCYFGSLLQDYGISSASTMAICMSTRNIIHVISAHDDVIKYKHFPRYWPLVRGIHRSPVNSPHKGQWCRALMFSLICAWLNSWVNNREAGDLRPHCAHYDVIAMNHHYVRRSRAAKVSSTCFIFGSFSE